VGGAEQDELRQQVERFAPVLEISPNAFVVIDPDANVVAWNAAAERLFGYSPAEAIGSNLDDLIASTEELHDDAVAIGERTRDRDRVQQIVRRTHKDGTFVDAELLAAPLMVDGRVVGMLGSYHDITELNHQRRLFEALLEVSPEAIALIDLDDRVTSWNPAAERLFGYTADEAVGAHINELVAGRADLRSEAEEIDRVSGAGETIHTLTQRTRKDGSLVDVDIVGGPLSVGGKFVAKHAFYHDVSELQEQKRYFQSLLDLSPAAIVVTDLDSRIVSWSPGAEKVFGHTAAEAVGSHLDDIVANDPELHQEALAYTDRAERGERLQATGLRTRKDGSLVDVQMFSEPVVVNEKRIGYVVIYHDISEVQQQRRWFESVLQLSPTAIVTVDDGTVVTSWNPGAERLFGYTAEEAIGSHLDDLVAKTPELREEAARFDADSIQQQEGGTRLITRRTRKDGSIVDVELVAAPVSIRGERVGWSVIYHDIGEIQRQKRYYEALVQANPVAIVLMEPDGTVTSWNPAAERLFGYPSDRAIGRHIDDLIATDASVRAEAERATEVGMSGELVHLITKRTRQDGTLVDVEVFGAPVIVGDEAVGLYGLFHDIGELQSAREEAEAATEAKSAFLATMSHEIRTPLNAVIGMTGLLLDTELSSEQRQFAEVIRGSGDALLGVINDILDFSKIEAGRLELERAPFDLRECVESALELVAPSAAAKGLDLAYDLDPRAPRGVVGDLTRVRQILTNLLSNAVKFTQEGEVVLTISSEPGRTSVNRRLTFSVRDTGIGIPRDRMDLLFQSFSQVDASTTRRYGGTGLGLAISRRLVELMDGSMWAESAVGQGSTFSFAVEMATAELPSRPFELANPPELGGKHVLVVDDNATNRQILYRQLSTWGMQVRETGSPHEALGWVRGDGALDLAIVDLQMPEMDGVMLASEIREVRDDLPLVLLSSLGGAVDVPAESFAASLTKPVRPSQLYEALLEVVGVGVEVASPPATAAGPDLASRHPLRILLVEDNAVNQQLALLLLEKLGYRADVAANGVEALEALDRQPYDAVLMDVEMPEMDGLEATRRIRERSSNGPHVVAVTANALQGERERCLAAGMNDYITKPLRLDELAAALGRSSRVDDGASPNPVDVEVLRRLVASLGEGGGDAVRGLIETFRTNAPDLVASLHRGAEDDDAESVRVAAHTLKSNASMFGASSLAGVARQVEASASGGSLDDGAPVDRLAPELERAMAELERLGPELGP
jgi:PAS domain S-box-containing protein